MTGGLVKDGNRNTVLTDSSTCVEKMTDENLMGGGWKQPVSPRRETDSATILHNWGESGYSDMGTKTLGSEEMR